MSVDWADMFPNGRLLFYEGDTPKEFALEMLKKFKFDPREKNKCWNEKCGFSFHCPASAINSIYNGQYPLGS